FPVVPSFFMASGVSSCVNYSLRRLSRGVLLSTYSGSTRPSSCTPTLGKRDRPAVWNSGPGASSLEPNLACNSTMMRITCHWPQGLALLVSLSFSVPAARAEEPKKEPPAKVSYYQHIRPIFQAHCQGCHQPAKARGDYIMTDFTKLLAGGAPRPQPTLR